MVWMHKSYSLLLQVILFTPAHSTEEEAQDSKQSESEGKSQDIPSSGTKSNSIVEWVHPIQLLEKTKIAVQKQMLLVSRQSSV